MKDFFSFLYGCFAIMPLFMVCVLYRYHCSDCLIMMSSVIIFDFGDLTYVFKSYIIPDDKLCM